MTAMATPRGLFLVSAAVTLAAVALGEPSPTLQVALLAPLVAVLGVPHGALDVDMARALWPLERRAARLAFGAGYLGVAAGVLGFWLIAPGPALAAFLAYSAAHFAGDWRDELARPARLAAGAAAIALPAAAHESEVARLFTALAPSEAATLCAAILHAAAPPLTAVAVAAAALARRPGVVAELVALTTLALVAPPLITFLVYFCGLHSPRHFVETIARLGLGWSRGVAAALPLSVGTLVLAAAGAAFLAGLDTAPEVVALKTVFVGLAALAVPHMVLVERFWTRA